MATPELLAETLRATLSSDPNIRIAAELKLSHDLTNPDSALALCQLVLIQSIDVSLRQSASIVLRKYVNEHWSPYFQSFKGAAPPFEAKGQMRQAIFQGLSDSERKIRSLSAVTLSHIAHCDWPDEYPDLLTNLLQLLSSGSPDSIHGAMQVFTEFIKSDLTEDQILPILRDLLPVLLNILGSTDHTPLTRSRTISVFRQCAEALFMVKEQHPQAVREATASVLPVWLEAFKVLLSIDPSQDFSAPTWDSLHVRIQVFKALDTLYSAFPKALIPYLPDLLTASLDHLQKLYVPFAKYYLSADAGSAPGTSEDESVDLSQLACPIFDFVGRIVRHGKAGAWLDDSNTTLLVSAVFKIAQMTTDDEETWASNVNAFTAQEGDDSVYGTRVAAFDLLTSLIDRNPVQIATTFQTIIQQVVSTSTQARDNGDQDWWRLLEATLAAIGSQAPPLLDCIDSELDDGRKPIDIEYLLANVIPSVLQLPEFPFLQGRAFVFASEYAQLLPLQLAGQYLEAAIHVLEAPESSIPVKVSAVKAVKKFCQAADDKNLQPYVERITKDLGPFLLVTSEESLSLVLDTLSVVIKVSSGSWISHDLASSLVIALLDVWSKNSKDPIFVGMFSDILQILASSSAPDVYPTVVKQALPTLCSAIANAKPSESYIASTGIDLVRSVLGGSPESGLGDGFFAMLAPVLFKTLAEAEDRDILQNGVGCLTLVVRKDCSQLLAWNDGNGRSGLDHVLVVIAKLLQSEGESGGLEIGDLIIHLLRNTGDAIAPVLPELLQAMLGRMRTAKTATFLQSLIVPFTYLLYKQRDTILDLLESTSIEGRSGLDILIQTWCENAETFQGFWPLRLSTVALTQLFVSQRPSLQNLMVKGDLIIRPETKNVIMTRSRTKQIPQEFTSISFPVKALKLVLRDLHSGGEAAVYSTIGNEAYDVDVDSDDEDWQDDGVAGGVKEDEFAYLSDLIGPKGVTFDNDEVLEASDDEDLKSDEISQMDIQAYLLNFFQECATRNTNNFSHLVDQMTAEEIQVIRSVVEQQQKEQ